MLQARLATLTILVAELIPKRSNEGAHLAFFQINGTDYVSLAIGTVKRLAVGSDSRRLSKARFNY